ncbi:4-azaleucine resistance probable transporter AzlC [Desulfocicer vacuolatum DSM 3385]|uniref:4-azaleucine resistance probable transporter AzlC n=1 Tax=Desulfocicer vacuolatum DSM 3385 TaxID=1121400 RepID=A0A1W2A2H4_9BACT|nr:AzlC family ABC transporter permease [Desulfocicer vacuolatum]SMC54508.1 4-azaleucine resistance probable transporter AzlC [Desulfocicer vacuolatum DSM 3385]
MNNTVSSIKNTPLSQCLEGAKDTFPLVVGAVPFGIIFGTLGATAGLSFAAVMGMSLFVFAGSSQFVCVSLVLAGTAWPMIVLTTFVVNLRHMLYGATMVPFYKDLNSLWKMVLAFGLTDETFAVAVTRYNRDDGIANKEYYNLGSMIFMYANWNFCTFVGLTAGKAFPEISQWGLDFAMPATFIGIVIPYLVSKPMWASVVIAGIISIVAGGLPHKLGLMVAAVAGVAVGLVCEKMFSGKKELI